MPYLRKVRKSKWLKNSNVPWMNSDDLQADALVDLKTEDNRLSVFFIDPDEENLNRVTLALAANSDFISNFDYALINDDDLDDIKIEKEKTVGYTFDKNVNDQHYDLTRLTTAKLCKLANLIKQKGSTFRVSQKTVFSIAAKALKENHLDLSKTKLNENSIQEIQFRAKNLLIHF